MAIGKYLGSLALIASLVGCASSESSDPSSTTGGVGGTSSGGSGNGGFPSGGTGGVPLECDAAFSFSVNPVQAGVPFDVSYTADTGYTFVAMEVTGPGAPAANDFQVTGSGPFTWTYTVSGHGEGVLSFDFLEGKTNGSPGSVLGSCQVSSVEGSGSGGTGGTLAGGFVGVNGTHFTRDGAEYQFVGANLRGLTHYGHNDALPYADAGQVELNLAAIQGMGGRVVRAFVSFHGIGAQETGDRLAPVLDAVAAHGLTLIVVLTDFYNTGFSPQGDDGFYATDVNGFTVLNHDFFASGYHQNYEPQVEALVTRFKAHPAIFSWELGNEIRDATFNGSSAATFIQFAKDMAGKIRSIDQNHMVSVGEISPILGWSQSEGTELFSDPNISFMTMRSYNGGDNDPTAFAAGIGKPIIVEEAGISGGNRPAQLAADLSKWFGKGCRGYLQWGFSAGTSDNGDGDTQYGMDKVWHKDDWDAMYATYKDFAATL